MYSYILLENSYSKAAECLNIPWLGVKRVYVSEEAKSKNGFCVNQASNIISWFNIDKVSILPDPTQYQGYFTLELKVSQTIIQNLVDFPPPRDYNQKIEYDFVGSWGGCNEEWKRVLQSCF